MSGRVVVVLFLLILAPPAAAAADPGRWTALDKIPIYYESHGNGSQTVVFIHGWTCDLSFWRLQQPLFQGRHVLLIDLPGHGRSGKPDIDYTQDLFARAVDAVLRHARVQQAVLVGHSMGGTVMRRFYHLYPEKVQALAAIDAPVSRPATDAAGRERQQAGIRQFVDSFRGSDHNLLRERFIDGMFSEQTPLEVQKEIRVKMMLAPRQVAISAMEGMAPYLVWGDEKISVPVLVVVSKKLSTPADQETYLRSVIPDLTYVEWEKSGHFLMMEQPERFNHVLAGFLERVH